MARGDVRHFACGRARARREKAGTASVRRWESVAGWCGRDSVGPPGFQCLGIVRRGRGGVKRFLAEFGGKSGRRVGDPAARGKVGRHDDVVMLGDFRR